MLTELRPKKDLLDPKFNGYKLSLDPIPVYRQSITEGVDHVTQSEDQYSFIHTKVFSLHNHLFYDPRNDNTVFFIDKTWKIRKASVSPETCRVERLETVWAIPRLDQRRTGHFNTSLVFPSPTTAVLANGCGYLYVLNRNNDTEWQPEGLSEGAGPGCGSLLLSARLAAESMHCVLMTLETVNADAVSSTAATRSDKPRTPTVNTVLHWITLSKDDTCGQWEVSCSRRLEGAGHVDYVALEPSCSALYVSSSAHFKFTSDSANPVPSPEVKMDTEVEKKPAYTWEQTADDLRVVVEVGAEVTRDDIEVVVRERELIIQCQQRTVVSGALSRAVDTELMTWTLQPDRLEITLSKQETGLLWSELVVGDTGGQQLLDPAMVETVHARLGHLCSDTEVREAGEGMAPTFNLDQLEECDTTPMDCGNLLRLDAVTHTISHQISLTGHQWLMTVVQSPDTAPCICVRHDVDGCVWQLDTPSSPTGPTDWPCQHVGTFCALGYVAASKQQKKFILAAPDLSYAVICEASSHVFVYRKASIVNGELRNRKTSAKVASVAKQQLINLESSSPVLGAHASSSHLFVLTTDMLYTFHIQ